jgi:hypothetical protein
MTVNYWSMTVNYRGILTLEIIGFFIAVIYHATLPQYFYNTGPWNHRNLSLSALIVELSAYPDEWSELA